MELRICRDHGISHSHFLGGKASWTALDRDKAKALALLEAEECPHCHTVREDWIDPDGDPLTEPVWVPDLKSCPGCSEMRKAEKHLTDDHRERGGYVALVPLVDYMAEAQS